MVEIFSDGCIGQFKNKFNLSNLLYAEHDFGVNLKWNFFASCHGAVDGIGGTVKRVVSTQVKARAYNVYSAQEFFECASNKIKGIYVIMVPKDTVQCNKEKLTKRWENLKPIKGIASLHYFAAANSSELVIGLTSMSQKKIIKII